MTHRLLALVLALGLSLVAGGCGGDSNDSAGSSSTTPSPTATSPTEPAAADVCDAKDKLDADVKGMKEDNTAPEYKASLTAISQDLKDLVTVADDAYSDDLATFQAALNTFADQVKSIGSSNQGALKTLEDLGQAAGALGDAAQTLAEQIPCPSNS
ncbi:hypothetical protein GCM10009844_24120 [Nocardioides koreensis]|uniref:Lipoprotein n=1 Tax=Nocardioides koreensis TaxID=433651 RepID=A0ABP5LLU1_9ACTN